MDIQYFLGMDAVEREQIFFNKKLYQKLTDEVMGVVILKGLYLSHATDVVSADFEKMDIPILVRITKVNGYPNKISNEVLANTFGYLNRSTSEIKKC